ncbi:calcium-binding protein [Sphingomonas sp. ID0503]|uniref:calcium-binding protein n=1 Tax=Sphingomonas sp. ID0503 TaxID=3399691 RepID=UPI003AFAF90B
MAKLIGNGKNNSIKATKNADTLDGRAGADTLTGGLGNDIYYVDARADVVKELAKQGTDTIRSSVDYDLPSNVEYLVLTGTAITGRGNGGDNRVTGNAPANVLIGGAGADLLDGGAGNDELDGGIGKDTLTGGSGRDAFVFASAPGASNIDRITDFRTGTDTILLSRPAFSKLGLGTLDDAAFRLGSAAKDGSDRIIYDKARGTLWYDADGNGKGKAVAIATLGKGTALAATDLHVYDAKADFTFDLAGKTYGKDAFGFVFDDFYYSVDASFDEGGSVGPFEGGVRGSVKAEAGLRAEMRFTSSTYDAVGGLDVTETTSKLAGVIDKKPYVLVGSTLHGAADASITGGAGKDNFIDIFVGAKVAASAGAYAEVDLGALGSPGVDFDFSVSATAGIDEHITADDAFVKDGDYGSFSVSLPKPVNDSDGYDTQAGAYGGTAIVVTATSDSFISVNADLSAMIAKVLDGIPGVGTLFKEHKEEADLGIASFGVSFQAIDLDMHGDVSMKEKVVFDPRILVTARSSFGETVKGTSTDKLAFATPEGEGKIVIDLSYQAEAVVTSTVYAHVGATFAAKFLHARLWEENDVPGIPNADFGVSAYDFEDKFAGTDIELAKATRTIAIPGVSTGQVTTQYEKFRTTKGSGDSWSLTTHQIIAAGNAAANKFVGNDYGNRITGAAGADTLSGKDGDDTLDGGAGKDVLYGNAGKDTVLAGADNDVVFGASGNDNIDGGDANDALYGDEGNDSLTGGKGDDTLYGGAGDDTLDGGDGRNVYYGGAGKDRMAGTGRNDTFYIDDIGDEALDGTVGDHDTVYTSVNYETGWYRIEKVVLTGKRNITARGNKDDATWLIGNSGNNVLWGGAGDDTLDGGAGADTLYGGPGDDTFVIDSTKDELRLDAGPEAERDSIISSVSFTLRARVDAFMSDARLFNLTLTGTKAINGTGNGHANLIIGNDAANVLDGRGAGGPDSYFGSNHDTLKGGRGGDTYIVGEHDTVVEAANHGIDTVKVYLPGWLPQDRPAYTLSANVENLVIIDYDMTTLMRNNQASGGIGNSLANKITGNRYDNLLDGKGGADTLTGGAGNDTYVFDNKGDRAIEKANGGIDWVKSSVSATLAQNVEHLALTGGGKVNGTGNGLANIIQGNKAANSLSGMSGNDTLDGGAGADTLKGGSGRDAFAFSTAPKSKDADRITDFSSKDDQFLLNIGAFFGDNGWSGRPYDGNGVLYSGSFVEGKAATAFNACIIYDNTTGRILWDSDGAAFTAAVLLATVNKGTEINYADFQFYQNG